MLGRFAYMGPTLLETMAQVHITHSLLFEKTKTLYARGSLDYLVKVTTVNCLRAILLFDVWREERKAVKTRAKRVQKIICKQGGYPPCLQEFLFKIESIYAQNVEKNKGISVILPPTGNLGLPVTNCKKSRCSSCS